VECVRLLLHILPLARFGSLGYGLREQGHELADTRSRES
jgi:hypothetical protein